SFNQPVTQSLAALTRKECQSLTITCVFCEVHDLENGHFFRQIQTGMEQERVTSGGRFIVLVNKAEKTFSLEIRDVKVEDSATYYCNVQHWYYSPISNNSSRMEIADGSGAVVTATADSSSPVSPSSLLQTSAAGDTVMLSYEYSGFCQDTVHWYRQTRGQTPKCLLQTYTSGDENKANAVAGRISASIESSVKISRLKISKLQLSDSAVYYCEMSWRTA
ncbi:uncharacterized protein LOC144489680, partial [Mustelus asterias]